MSSPAVLKPVPPGFMDLNWSDWRLWLPFLLFGILFGIHIGVVIQWLGWGILV